MRKVILLFGGESSEHEVSLKSAKFIFENIDRKKYKCIPIGITKEGVWRHYYGDSFEEWENDSKEVLDVINTLRSCDIVFPIIHGAYGEDGRIQSLCELFHINYVGCDSKSSMLCMDKEYTKIIVEKHGINIVPYMMLNKKSLKNVQNYPVVVKPANGGSSIGIGIANNRNELKKRYKEARIYDEKVIVEDYKRVRELEVAILSDTKKYYISGIGEIITNGELYDYTNKYVNSKQTSNRAIIPRKVEKRLYEMLEELLVIFHINGMARVDFFYVEEEDTVYFNEINTIPGFTGISMYPALLGAVKIRPTKLISMLLESCHF